MSNIPNAEPSPRIVNGYIKWYQGDTFDLDIELELTDQSGEEIEITPTDTVKVVFRDEGDKTVKVFDFSNIQGKTITLDFDAECSALFPKGNYFYDVYFSSDDRKTIANDNRVVVE